MLARILNHPWIVQWKADAWLPWMFLLLALPITFAIWQNEKQNAYAEQQIHFEAHVQEANDLIRRQLYEYEHTLIGIQSFFRASSYVSEAEFNDYVGVLLQPGHLPGLKSLAFAKYIHSAIPKSYDELHQDWQSLTDKMQPQAARDSYAPIVYAAPDSSLLRTSLKHQRYLDVLGEPVIRQSLLQAVNTNTAMVSPVMQSIQGDKIHDCFLMHLPIYENDSETNNAAQRRAHIYGWVLATVNSKQFFSQAIAPVDNGLLSYVVLDAYKDKPTGEIYKTYRGQSSQHRPLFIKQKSIQVMGYQWILVASSLPKFELTVDYKRANQIGLLGILISLTLTCVLFLLVARIRAADAINQVSSRLNDSEQRWQFALEGAGDGVWDWNVSTNKVVFSKRWKEMLGFKEWEIGDDVNEWKTRVHPEDYVSVMLSVEATLNGNSNIYSNEHRMQCKDGSWKWILDRGMVVSRDAEGAPLRMVGTHTDISNLKKSEETIWQQANFDSLTGLPNRRMFYIRLDQEIQKAKRSGLKVALIFLDLDGFKEVNDTLGHDQGDVLLKLTANRLVECMRGSDAVARLGGDEFVLTIEDIGHADLAHVESVAQKVLHALSQPFQLTYETAYISASIGIAIFPDDAIAVEDLMKSVDQAMYASKQKGGHCFSYFTTRMQEVAQHRMQLSNDLRQAIQQQQLYLEYQPIVDLRTGRIHKAEALVRWQHPTRGNISPAEFIPIAEDARLIHEIGDWVFKQAFRQVVEWRERLVPNFQITVNMSPIQFNSEDDKTRGWIDFAAAQQAHGSALVIEITERLLLDPSLEVKQRLKILHEMGMQVALDDFGTGYSSLSYLNKFNIDYLKMDKSFVANVSEGSDDLILCEAIIMMAHRLGMHVIAEGIETPQQRGLLIKAGCDYAQGFLFAKSLSPKDFEAYVLQQNQRTFLQKNTSV